MTLPTRQSCVPPRADSPRPRHLRRGRQAVTAASLRFPGKPSRLRTSRHGQANMNETANLESHRPLSPHDTDWRGSGILPSHHADSIPPNYGRPYHGSTHQRRGSAERRPHITRRYVSPGVGPPSSAFCLPVQHSAATRPQKMPPTAAATRTRGYAIVENCRDPEWNRNGTENCADGGSDHGHRLASNLSK